MTTALQTTTEFSKDQIDLIKRTIAVGATDDELHLFLMQSKRMGLDPFSRQIHAVKRKAWDSDTRETRDVMSIQVGIDGYRLVADRTGRYAPGRATTYEYDDDGNLRSATAYVQKCVSDHWMECSATAHLKEYQQTKKDGNPTQMWANKPHIMLGKCAEALALRRAFPAELSGVYTDDEMPDQHDVIEVKATQAQPDERTALKDRIAALGKQAKDKLAAAHDSDEAAHLGAAISAARDVYAKNGSATIDELKDTIATLEAALA